jgi:hypothetical protein
VANPLDCDREAVAPVVCWRFSAASFSSAGSGRKRGPTLLETHNENSATTTTVARKIRRLDEINWVMDCIEILPETIAKSPSGLTHRKVAQNKPDRSYTPSVPELM